MSKRNETKREILEDKFPQMEQKFKELEKDIFEPQIERLGETGKEQKERSKKPV